jgi:hypothetical protein
MEYEINELKGNLWLHLVAYQNGLITKEFIQAYVKALNILEDHYYGEARTQLETVLEPMG